MKKQELPQYRIVCQGVDEKITLRAKAKDKYEAFEQVVVFLRSKGFDYHVVLVEPKHAGTAARA
jgi:biopolymer transport protein ExbD